MEKAYLVSLSTGGLVQGLYSTLQRAQDAVRAHYLMMNGSGQQGFIDHVLDNMVWVQVHDSWLWLPVDWDRNRNPHGQNNTLDDVLTDVTITVLPMDATALPVV